jgi:protoporphyrinogen oxidase
VDRLKVREADGSALKDNWIYIQEPDVLVGRIQIFNNWSPYMVADPAKTWIGLEYFCYETDSLWKMPDEELKKFAISEVEKIGILNASDVSDGHVVRVPKTYPAYFGTYDRFDVIRRFMARFENLFLVGRNGMHKYNNQDHSMLTAMTAVDNITAGITDKENLWSINTEMEYHEEKADKDAHAACRLAETPDSANAV